jgi:hypothetical protein
MSDKLEKEHKKELMEMLNERKTDEPVEEVLAIFCQRHGTSMSACRTYYDQLVQKGEVKKK